MTDIGPRVVIAGVASGVGKTTVATGLLAALTRRGVRAACAKVGPDFIDPGYHSAACGRPPRNLDAWLCGSDAVAPLAARASAGAELLVIEGVMGLFDGANDGTPSSTADIAALIDAPVVLVIDASSTSSSVAAIARGFRDHDARIDVQGVVLNRVASDAHAEILREALDAIGVRIVGVLRRDDRLVWRDRHLGLIPVAERPTEVRSSLDRLAVVVDASFDLDAIVTIARGARPLRADDVILPERQGACRIAVAAGPAFSFTYHDNLEALEAAGAEVIPFDPTTAPTLPPRVDGLVAGGGFPEVHGEALSANTSLLADVRTQVSAGLPTWAECGGLLWLARELDGRPMVGAVPATAKLGPKLFLGYRSAELATASPIGPAGTRIRGHEFHYSTCDPGGDAMQLTSRFRNTSDGFATTTLLATYLHHHAGGDPSALASFVRTCVSSTDNSVTAR